MTQKTVTLFVEGMHCASCGLLVDDSLEDLQGVATAQTDTRRKRTVVVADLSVTSVDAIVTVISAVGYRATLVGD